MSQLEFYPLSRSLFSFQNNNLFNLIVPKQILGLTLWITLMLPFAVYWFIISLYFLSLYIVLVVDILNKKDKIGEHVSQKVYVFNHSNKNFRKICYELEGWINICPLAFEVMSHLAAVSSVNYNQSREHTHHDGISCHGSQADRYISLWLGDSLHSRPNTDIPVYSPSHMCLVDKLREEEM